MSHYRIAMVGSKEAVAGFALLGMDVVPADTPKDALQELYALRRKTQLDAAGIERPLYAIIFVTEDLVSAITPEDEKKLARGALPAILPLPSHRGSTGFGQERLKRIVERAIGSNILA